MKILKALLLVMLPTLSWAGGFNGTSGGGGNGNFASLQSPATGPYNLNGFGISNSTGLEAGGVLVTTTTISLPFTSGNIPSLYWGSDPASGLYGVAGGVVGIKTNGSSNATFTPSGMQASLGLSVSAPFTSDPIGSPVLTVGSAGIFDTSAWGPNGLGVEVSGRELCRMTSSGVSFGAVPVINGGVVISTLSTNASVFTVSSGTKLFDVTGASTAINNQLIVSSSVVINGSGAGQTIMSEGVASGVIGITGGVDVLWADSGRHALIYNANNTSSGTVVTSSQSTIVGHSAVWSGQGSLIDGGAVSAGGVGNTTWYYISQATDSLNMNGYGIRGSSQIILGGTTGQATVQVSSFNASPNWVALSLTSGTEKAFLDATPSSFTIRTATFIATGPGVIGSTIAASAENGSTFNRYDFRAGNGNQGIFDGGSTFNGVVPFLFSKVLSTSWIGFTNGTVQMGWGLSNGSSLGRFGTLSNHNLNLLTNNSVAAVWDTSGNLSNTGVMKNPNGTVAAPSYSFANSITSGFYIEPTGLPANIAMSNVGKETMKWWGDAHITIGAKTKMGSVLISTTVSNEPIITISSESPKFQVGGSTVWAGTVFGVFPSSSNGFTNSAPSTYSMVVSSFVPFGGTAPTASFNFSVDTRAHVNSHGAPPVLSSCGTSTIDSNSSSNHGYVSVLGVVTSCVLTFAVPYDNRPDCIISDDSTAIAPAITAITNTGFTAGFSLSLANGHFSYHCDGND